MVDVCLLVEGSYPYVTGGVAQWVDDLTKAMPDVSFGVAHVRPEEAPRLAPAYEPRTDIDITCIDVEDRTVVPERGLEDRLPDARVYHATSTGSAGELARRAAAARGAGLALTEHGLAWRDIVMSPKWPKPPKPPKSHHVRADLDRVITREQLERLGADAVRLARDLYAEAGAVTSVCTVNAAAQAAAGAPRERLRVIPNPVAAPDAAAAVPADGFLTAFVGRVAPEKELETYLRACALVAAELPGAEFAVVGPLDQDPTYADACLSLAASLELGEAVRFTGETDPAPWYARMDVLALTSRTEAQPLVALEAMAAGVPVVATDVGGCRETIADAGLLCRPRDPRATADAILRLAHDELLRARLAAAGRRRTAERHDPQRVYGAYRELYDRLAA